MKKVFLVLLMVSATAWVRAQESTPAGHWEGRITLPTTPLHIQVDLEQTSAAEWQGKISIPAQGLRGFALDGVRVRDRLVGFLMPHLPGNPSFKGELSPTGQSMAGEFSQSGQTFPFKLERKATTAAPGQRPGGSTRAVGRRRPQDPIKPYPYIEEQVTVHNAEAGLDLAGTLTLPQGAGPFTAVVLITGSGPQDRDEALMGHRPFLVLADHLTRQGIAVLRCDDRGVGESTGDFALATHEDFALDAQASVGFLKRDKRIDRIGLIGHSEGGIIAPLVAVKAPDDVAFLVLLAGIGVPMQELLIRHDPRPVLRQVQCPVLAINGEKDLQVAAEENLEAIRTALGSGGNRQVETRVFPGLNHLFQHCQSGAITEYGQIEETVAPEALHAISYWINRRSMKSRPVGR